MDSTKCCINNKTNHTIYLSNPLLNNYFLVRCNNCSIVTARDASGNDIIPDYSNFGDYLFENELKNTEKYVATIQIKQKSLFKIIKEKYRQNSTLLDIGSGAGYFLMAAHCEGIEESGVEISERLHSYSLLKLNGVRVFESLQNVSGMFDVIEHLLEQTVNEIITIVFGLLKPRGVLLESTPNVASVNIKFYGVNDPTISPPLHLYYFSPSTLHKPIKKHGFIKNKNYTQGLSKNSFFRPPKDE